MLSRKFLKRVRTERTVDTTSDWETVTRALLERRED